MGRPGLEEPDTYDGIHQHLYTTRPTSSSSNIANLRAAHVRHSVSRALSYSDQPTPHDGPSDGSIVPAIPGDVCCETVITPLPNETSESSMDLLVGGALAPVQTAPPRPPPPLKAGPGLRLPPFEQLGIAAPHPDRLGGVSKEKPAFACASGTIHELPHVVSEELEFLPLVEGMSIGSTTPDSRLYPDFRRGEGRAIQPPLRHYVNTLTPPSEGGAPSWDPSPTVQIPGMHSPATDPGSVTARPDEVDVSTSTDALAADRPDDNGEAIDGRDESSWIDDAVNVLLDNIRTSLKANDSLKILSHALPSTSPSGHVFTRVINAISGSTPISPMTPLTWINVFHAIPGRFNLADLPTSPPSTPGPPIGGEDYFTQKIFDSAVSILDYQDPASILPRSPRPVVPPSSIDVSIVERYIPPSTSNEFSEMFDPNGSSILIDRLVELSPDNGSLLFIYPTRSGARTFIREYLSPILGPLLRTMAVVNGLSSDLCNALDDMRAVYQLLEHEPLRQRTAMLCNRLTQGTTASRRALGQRSTFTLSHASRQYVKLQRGVWAREWWTKQEKTRLRETITNHLREPQIRRGSSHEYAAQQPPTTVLLQQLLDGVAGSPGKESEVPDHAIEISVFVITRSE